MWKLPTQYWNKLTCLPHAETQPRASWWHVLWYSFTAGIAGMVMIAAPIELPILQKTNSSSAFVEMIVLELISVLVLSIAVWIGWRNPVRVPNTVERRIAPTTIIISLIGIIANIFLTVLDYVDSFMLVYDLLSGVITILWLAQALTLARRGMPRRAATLLVTGLFLFILAHIYTPTLDDAFLLDFQYVLLILLSGLFIRWWAGLGSAVLLALLGPVAYTIGLLETMPSIEVLMPQLVLHGIIAAVVATYARSLETALITVDAHATSLTAAQVTLAEQNHTLEQRVIERTASLARATAEAQQARTDAEMANTLKTKFVANMSHELRTPLNAIINFTRIIEAGIRGPVTDGQRDYLERVRHSGEHLLGLINDILDLSKIEAGRMDLFPEPVQLADLIRGVLATTSGLTKGKPITLEHQIGTNLPLVHVDRTRMRQVLLNLLSNAAKFTEAGSITVRVVQTVDTLEVRVTDTGIGIPPAHLATIFEEFRQVDDGSTRQYEGTGLGLAICRRLVELHGGKLWVESTVGVGSTFAFHIPLPVDPAPLPHPETTAGDLTILMIDNDPHALEIVQTDLGTAGYHVVSIQDSRQALEAARLHQPAVIILDVRMPYKDGWAVLADLKADPQTQAIPVIFYSMIDDRRLGMQLGASAYLVKPATAAEVQATVAQFIHSQGRILVIDDDADARAIVVDYLQQHGEYEVMTATNGREALATVTTTTPDLILLDLMMPEMDGFTVLNHLSQNATTAQIPVVVLTAKDLTVADQIVLHQHTQGWITKGERTLVDILSHVERAIQPRVS